MDVSSKPNYMFSQQYYDYFFNWRWWVAPLIFIPVALAAMVIATEIFASSFFALIASFFGGVLFWTFIEYLLHRFAFHFVGESPMLKHLHYVVHGMHHAYPTDPNRVIFPPFLSLPVGMVIFSIMLLIMPYAWAFGAMAGFIVGYCWYEFIHYASHHIKWRIPQLKRLKRHHLLHHHSEAFRDKNFGVTTVLWDHIFGTYLV